MDKKEMTYLEALATPASGRGQEEIYGEIVKMVKRKYDGNISDVEAHAAARNLIDFVKVLMEIHEDQIKAPAKESFSELVKTIEEEDLWTHKDVAYCFERAVRTLKLLPPEKIRGYKTLWPDINYSEAEILQQQANSHLRLRAKTEDVTNLENVLEWITWVNTEERLLIWARANKKSWKVICREFGCARTKAWEDWRTSLNTIANILNKKGIYKTIA